MTASVALVDDEKIIAEYFLNNGLTHSQNLMPMVELVYKLYKQKPEHIAVTVGPGSFTGVRIAVSAVKGLAIAEDIPCTAVSCLEALAYNFLNKQNSLICTLLDARCDRAYVALFRQENGVITRLWQDDCLELSVIFEKLKEYNENIVLTGGGVKVFADKFSEFDSFIATETDRYIKGSSVAFASNDKPKITADEIQPMYLQLPQAQRELNNKLKKNI